MLLKLCISARQKPCPGLSGREGRARCRDTLPAKRGTSLWAGRHSLKLSHRAPQLCAGRDAEVWSQHTHEHTGLWRTRVRHATGHDSKDKALNPRSAKLRDTRMITGLLSPFTAPTSIRRWMSTLLVSPCLSIFLRVSGWLALSPQLAQRGGNAVHCGGPSAGAGNTPPRGSGHQVLACKHPAGCLGTLIWGSGVSTRTAVT